MPYIINTSIAFKKDEMNDLKKNIGKKHSNPSTYYSGECPNTEGIYLKFNIIGDLFSNSIFSNNSIFFLNIPVTLEIDDPIALFLLNNKKTKSIFEMIYELKYDINHKGLYKRKYGDDDINTIRTNICHKIEEDQKNSYGFDQPKVSCKPTCTGGKRKSKRKTQFKRTKKANKKRKVKSKRRIR